MCLGGAPGAASRGGGERVRVLTFAVQPCPTDGQRQQVSRRGVPPFGLDDRESEPPIGRNERDGRRDAGAGGRVSAFCVPALVCQKRWKHVTFKHGSRL